MYSIVHAEMLSQNEDKGELLGAIFVCSIKQISKFRILHLSRPERFYSNKISSNHNICCVFGYVGYRVTFILFKSKFIFS